MKLALLLFLLVATLSGCMTSATALGHATVTLHDTDGLPAATVATLQAANPETPAQGPFRRMPHSDNHIDHGKNYRRNMIRGARL